MMFSRLSLLSLLFFACSPAVDGANTHGKLRKLKGVKSSKQEVVTEPYAAGEQIVFEEALGVDMQPGSTKGDKGAKVKSGIDQGASQELASGDKSKAKGGATVAAGKGVDKSKEGQQGVAAKGTTKSAKGVGASKSGVQGASDEASLPKSGGKVKGEAQGLSEGKGSVKSKGGDQGIALGSGKGSAMGEAFPEDIVVGEEGVAAAPVEGAMKNDVKNDSNSAVGGTRRAIRGRR